METFLIAGLLAFVCGILLKPSGPLGALVGGYSDAEWLYDEVLWWVGPWKPFPGDLSGLFRFLVSKSAGDWFF